MAIRKRANYPKPRKPPRPSREQMDAYFAATHSCFGPYGHSVAEGMLNEYFSRGGDLVEDILKLAADGRGKLLPDGSILFPKDLAEAEGGPPERFGYIRFEGWSAGIYGESEMVYFGDAMHKLERLAEHYVNWRPDRADAVAALLVQVRATMVQMVADFDAWHRDNPESQWVPG